MGSSVRVTLSDGSYVDWSLVRVAPDKWRPHGVRYRLAWIQNIECRLLLDNHHGKHDHMHIDGAEMPYAFKSVEKLWDDFMTEIKRMGGPT